MHDDPFLPLLFGNSIAKRSKKKAPFGTSLFVVKQFLELFEKSSHYARGM
ncbi:hypothetical protein HMPREF1863_00263 [Aedoeadaptatus coxii]|uniref:Uncharacterized protein n=1 Tax=Aedoeadaptatus coxii TaxID=755172 RepID=A0A134AKL1_9FIRM|nr:hypothetical protein HMPREF1863_00263 [Peptoniphilus coxii]